MLEIRYIDDDVVDDDDVMLVLKIGNLILGVQLSHTYVTLSTMYYT